VVGGGAGWWRTRVVEEYELVVEEENEVVEGEEGW
jgi:hypothetical protein